MQSLDQSMHTPWYEAAQRKQVKLDDSLRRPHLTQDQHRHEKQQLRLAISALLNDAADVLTLNHDDQPDVRWITQGLAEKDLREATQLLLEYHDKRGLSRIWLIGLLSPRRFNRIIKIYTAMIAVDPQEAVKYLKKTACKYVQ